MSTKKLNESVNTVANPTVPTMSDLEAKMAELKKLESALKDQLKTAKLIQKRANGRPIRHCRFEVYDNFECVGEPLHKGDVHYCEEKFAIDAVKDGKAEQLFIVYRTKDVTEKEQKFLPIARVYLDENGIINID